MSIKSEVFEPGVSIITTTCRLNYMDSVFQNYTRQNYKNKELIIVLNNNKMDIEKYKKRAKKYKNIKVLKLDETATLGQCRNLAISHTSLDYIAIFDDDDYYGPNYLKSSIKVFNEVNADIIGKASFYIYFEKSKTLAIFHHNHINQENQYVEHVADPSMIFNRKVFETIGYYPNSHTDPDAVFQGYCINYGFKIYSIDKFNFVLHRHPNPSKQHTWKVEEKDILKACYIVEKNIADYTKCVNR
ncbi:glycosyltransferase [Paramaledivibacter caminithermalis]|uniref:Glycosyl transferase family 2 n=1 Tax=Paramaledivibacter caminithermalis (strain DSM 15212 / CIP 107654 / DViRD3) TaxID=1121301 RepID=A0A1M6JUF5_PARC5|nr:glycosyltransferase family A protein [Paramaledivibacter caminithermalis]SHJ50323.1 Glycosyl transferase family 2 [Paramaledivibacter caminithermalis DSM 15212]